MQTSYARWAPVYDRSFGAVTQAGRRRAVDFINKRGGRVLEVGVGTGLSLPLYGPGLEVTGIDFSQDMLRKAKKKVATMNLTNVRELRQMDARALDFPDNHFDTVAAMHVLSVVPEPERVVAEIARVCAPGGRVVVSNHFQRKSGFLAALERLLAPCSSILGWHPDFEIETVLQEERLSVESRKQLPPMGMMTLLVLKKSDAGDAAQTRPRA